jgi:hypothetical protein
VARSEPPTEVRFTRRIIRSADHPCRGEVYKPIPARSPIHYKLPAAKDLRHSLNHDPFWDKDIVEANNNINHMVSPTTASFTAISICRRSQRAHLQRLRHFKGSGAGERADRIQEGNRRQEARARGLQELRHDGGAVWDIKDQIRYSTAQRVVTLAQTKGFANTVIAAERTFRH